MNTAGPVRVVLVGMGARASIYAREASEHPENMRVVGVADVNPAQVRRAREAFQLPEDRCFPSAEALAAAPRFADGAINATMDPQHVATTLPLLDRGYDVLLEKPFALCQRDADLLLRRARETGRRVMVCHVLRYAPFYRRIKEELLGGAVGRITGLTMAEQVSYYHQSVSYLRGKYASPSLCGSGMLLSKCSHDLDLLAWFMAGNPPERVSSLGAQTQFRPENAPAGAGTRCLTDCAAERTCPYSARTLYLEHPQRWCANVWRDSGLVDPDEAEKERLLSDPACPYDRCVYRLNPGIVDHQAVTVSFRDGATAVFTMTGGAARASRTIRITGSRGEIAGRFEDERFDLTRIAPAAPGGCETRTIDVSGQQRGDAHGGGDRALVLDFLAMLRGEPTSVCSTALEDSAIGHRLAFLAEDSRLADGAPQRFARGTEEA